MDRRSIVKKIIAIGILDILFLIDAVINIGGDMASRLDYLTLVLSAITLLLIAAACYVISKRT